LKVDLSLQILTDTRSSVFNYNNYKPNAVMFFYSNYVLLSGFFLFYNVGEDMLQFSLSGQIVHCFTIEA